MKKNVLHLLASNKYSGAENVACNIIKNSKENCYYCSPQGEIEKILNKKEIKYIPLKKFNTSNLKKIIKEYNINVIHAHDFKASFLSSFVASKDVKVVSHLHCNYKLLKIKKITSFVYSNIQKKFSRIIVVSNEILNDAPFGKKIKDKTILLSNVVDKNNIINLSNEYETDKYDLLFLGRLIDLKQPLFFIEIVNDLKKDNPNIKACILGQGVLYDECKEKIKFYKLEKNIDLVGFKSNPFPYVKNSKIQILPSKFEGLPMSVIEAMILNVPVVNSGVGGLSDMFKDNKEYICKTKKEYINCILNLLNKKPNDYKKDCESIVKDFVDMNKYIKKIDKIYKEI